MTTAIIETNGAGTPTGVWVAGPTPADPPDVAFTDPVDQLMAEKKLGEAAATIDAGAGTWAEFMANLQLRQDRVVIERWWGDTDLGAPELLAAVHDAVSAGRPPASALA